jgi:hypothetical protein
MISFTYLRDEEEEQQLVDHLRKYDFNYPYYQSWVDRCIPEIESGKKQAFLGYSGDSRHNYKLVSSVLFQKHKSPQLSRVIELKSARVDPDFRQRDFLRFSLKQIENEFQDLYDGFIVDVREDNPQNLGVLMRVGFRPIYTISLYDPAHTDIVAVKLFRKEGDLLISKIQPDFLTTLN